MTIHVYGYESVWDYYRNFGSVNRISDIKVPMLGISSYDDKVCYQEALPYDKFMTNENLILYVTPRGGHIGWVEGPWWNMKHWFIKPSLQFISALVEHNE